MLAFFSLLIPANGSHQISNGTLFPVPPELRDHARIQKYLSLKGDGWHVSEYGYHAYVKTDTQGTRFIVPGLYLIDGSRPVKKFPRHQPSISRQQVEQYLSEHFKRNAEIRSKSDDELTALIHDLRHLSTSIYHSAVQASQFNENSNIPGISDSIKTIIATQTMLKVRIDYLDFNNNTDRFDEIEEIPVYKRVDKVVRCFKASAKHKNVDIRLNGQSFGVVKGPNILDIVPYTLIDNAVKYSPSYKSIDINIHDSNGNTYVQIQSIGPILNAHEKDKIFLKHYRSANAIDYRSAGTGIGLSVAKEIVCIFKGDISVETQDTQDTFDNITFQPITFSFCVPTSNPSRKSRVLRRSKMTKARD